MTSTRIAEAKGLLLLLLVIAVMVFGMMAMSGKLEDWFGISLFRAPNVAGKIVFVSDRNGHNDIWTMNRDGSDARALTNDKFDDGSPVWSPDGTEIVFVSNRDKGRYGLYGIPYDGGRIRKVSMSSGTKSDPSISHDGKHLAFVSSGKVFEREMNGSHEEQIMPKFERGQGQQMVFSQPDWSSSGDWIASVSSLEDGQAVSMLNTSSGDFGIAKDDKERPVAGQKVGIAWSNSGHRLATTVIGGAEGNCLAMIDMDRESFYLVMQSADAEHAAIQPAWSPDDSKLVLVNAKVDGPENITPAGLIVTDSSEGAPTTIETGNCDRPRWSKDGKSIIYTKTIGGKRDVWSVEVDAPTPANLTKGRGNNFDACWAPGAAK